MKKVAFYTLGCKVNQYETQAIARLFEKEGYRIVDFSENADVYVINTCTVTGMSARKSRQIIRRAKNRNEDSIIVAVGCYAQTAPEEIENIPGVNLFCHGPHCTIHIPGKTHHDFFYLMLFN
jgi:threonylcarbamoyladenosine tRNA methylthiotransferase MtaB